VKTAVLFPGSFDPLTRGHFAVIETASRFFDEVRVAIFVNPDKTCLFPLSDRLAFLRLATAGLPNVTVDASDGLVADYVRENRLSFIFKGVRTESDYLYERGMADWNAVHGAKTVLFPSPADVREISSTELRMRLERGLPIDDVAAPGTADAIVAAYRRICP